MKRPGNVDNFNSEKVMKFGGSPLNRKSSITNLNNLQNPYMSTNVPPPPTPPMQTQMQSYYMTSGAYYPAVMSPDLANSMYSQFNLSPWQINQATTTQPVYDTARPQPPPLPALPPPEKPPPPPMPVEQRNDPSALQSFNINNTYITRGGYGGFGGRGGYRRYGQFKGGYNRGASSKSAISPPVGPQPPQLCLLGNLSTQRPATLENAKENRANGHDHKQKNSPIVHEKKRRKPMSERLPTLEWKREDAQRVLDLEKEYNAKKGKKSVIVRFPDPKIDYDVVKKFSSFIESVHFRQRVAPRSCIVHLKKGSDIDEVVEELNKTSFGLGFLSATPERDKMEDEELALEDIDPYTLYIGNFPSDVNVDEVKAMFPKAKKVDVGYAQKVKLTRYGFVRYTNVDDAIEAYKKNYNALYKSRSIIVRFRRNNRSIGLFGERKSPRKEDKKKGAVENINTTNEEVAIENESITYENDSEIEDDVEDTKSGIFDYTNNTMDNWLCNDLDESDNHDREDLPNLTGMIKSEPDDETCNDLFRTKDGNLVPPEKGMNKGNTKCTSSQKLTANNDIMNQVFKVSSRSNNYWEEIRQRELNETEKKPDIQNLQPSKSPERTPTETPITSYGLVPLIFPKEEQDNVNDRVEEIEDDLDDLESAFDQDENDVDKAFENAWNVVEDI